MTTVTPAMRRARLYASCRDAIDAAKASDPPLTDDQVADVRRIIAGPRRSQGKACLGRLVVGRAPFTAGQVGRLAALPGTTDDAAPAPDVAEPTARPVPGARPQESVVYFAERDGFVKIGVTTRLPLRLATIGKGGSMIEGTNCRPGQAARHHAGPPGRRAGPA